MNNFNQQHGQSMNQQQAPQQQASGMGFSFNQEAALKGGETTGISESGAYVVNVEKFLYKVSSAKGAQGVELNVETVDGLSAKYLTLWTASAEGKQYFGYDLVMSFMGLATPGQNLSVQQRQGEDGQENFAPEAEGKQVGMVLQKVLYSKNDGSEGYKFEIKRFFCPQTGKTLKEKMNNRDAVDISKMIATLKDKDERRPAQSQGDPYAQQVPDHMADDGWDQFSS